MPLVKCEGCGKDVYKYPSGLKRTKHNFCTIQCANKNLRTRTGRPRKEICERYRQRNKEKIAASQRKYNYGISAEEFNTRLTEQEYKCSICHNTLVKPHQDHDHNTGLNRGILCSACNRGLGCFRDNEQVLIEAATYIKYWNNGQSITSTSTE